MKQAAAVLIAATIAGCAGSTKPSSMTGCKGLPTSRQPAAAVTDVLKLNTFESVCAKFGAPQKIARNADGTVTWAYRSVKLRLKGHEVVEYATVDRSGPDATYEVTESVRVERTAN